MGINERKQREKQEMEKFILDTAMKILLEDGIDNLSIRKIADVIEYSPTTIYIYFKDKEEILYALHNIAFDKFLSFQKSIQFVDDPKERLKAHGMAYIKFARENPEYYDLMFILDSSFHKADCDGKWDKGMESYELLKSNVKDAMDAGYLEEMNLDIAAFAHWAMVHGISSLFNKRGIMFPKAYLDQIASSSMDLFSKIYNK